MQTRREVKDMHAAIIRGLPALSILAAIVFGLAFADPAIMPDPICPPMC